MAPVRAAACMALMILSATICHGAHHRKLHTFDKVADAIHTVVQAKVDAVQELFDSHPQIVVITPAPTPPPTSTGAFAAAQASATTPPPPTSTSASASAAASATATTTPPTPPAPAPAPCKTVYQTAQSVPELSTLVALVQAAGLVAELNDTALVATVFAPTNAAITAAINALGVSQSDILTNRELLRQVHTLCSTSIFLHFPQILTTHIVLGKALLSSDLRDNQVLASQSGAPLTIDLGVGGTVTVKAPGSSAKVVQANVKACAAVVHVIDFVLLPSAPAPRPAPKVAPAPAPSKATPPTAAIARAGAEAVVAG